MSEAVMERSKNQIKDQRKENRKYISSPKDEGWEKEEMRTEERKCDGKNKGKKERGEGR